ncbi:MAG: DJ-1/PfpI family protein [Erysipelotrichaceae bacterium]|nr:DJ-1/PfpI family protein [Erysipelotrichaceae bacterium]
MSKVAVLMATGYEEGETLTIVDILRRADIECHTFYFDTPYVEGMHHMFIKGDKKFSDEIKDYDMVVLPGGRPGGQNLKENPEVISLLKWFNDNNKYIAALCSGTTVLEEAKVITGKKVTGYTGYAEKLPSGIFSEDLVVFDQNIVTSQGPATPYPIAYKIAEIFGKDTTVLRERMLYNLAGGK